MSRIDSTHKIELLDQDGKRHDASVVVEINDRIVGRHRRTDVRVEIRGGGFASVVGNSWLVLGAFNDARRQIELIGLTPRCHGSSVNLAVSGMAADMWTGYRGYLVPEDRELEQTDLVSIFDVSAVMRLGTVAEQEQFQEQWMAADRKRQGERKEGPG